MLIRFYVHATFTNNTDTTFTNVTTDITKAKSIKVKVLGNVKGILN